MTPLAAVVLLFAAVGVGFILVHLLAGQMIRPSKPGGEKDTIYECGEPTIGSAWIQFDLRFYVVALLFVIFDVEVAFFFPWAEVFGKANAVVNTEMPTDPAGYRQYARKILELADPPISGPGLRLRSWYEDMAKAEGTQGALTQEDLDSRRGRDSRFTQPFKGTRQGGIEREFARNRDAAQALAWAAFFEVLVFFGVLLVGFAYLWRRGDLEWVRSVAGQLPRPDTPPGAG